jgi:hypothetical protein
MEEETKERNLYILIGAVFLFLGFVFTVYTSLFPRGSESTIYSAEDLSRPSPETYPEGYHTQVRIDPEGVVLPDEMNREYDRTNLLDVMLAFIEAFNEKKMDTIVDTYLVDNYGERYPEVVERIRNLKPTHRVTGYQVVRVEEVGDRTQITYRLFLDDGAGHRTKSDGIQEFLQEDGLWKLANHMIFYSLMEL